MMRDQREVSNHATEVVENRTWDEARRAGRGIRTERHGENVRSLSDVDERRARDEEPREVEGGSRELAGESEREREREGASGIKEGALSHPAEG